MRVLNGEMPEWIPVECPPNPIYGQGAYHFVTYRGALPDQAGGYDLWGVRWQGLGHEKLPYIVEHAVSTIDELAGLRFPDIEDPTLWPTVDRLAAPMNSCKIARQVSSLWERLYFLIGFDEALSALVTNPDLVTEALHRICDWQIKAADRFLAIGVNAVRISDDYGSQENLLMSPKVWRALIRPHLGRLVERYHRANVPVALHSCGRLALIMDDLIELGFAAFNIQTNANDFAEYKKRYGRRFRVWGGVSTQSILSVGPPARVRVAVKEIVELLGPDGCLILEPDQLVPLPEKNLEVFWDSAWQLQNRPPIQ